MTSEKPEDKGKVATESGQVEQMVMPVGASLKFSQIMYRMDGWERLWAYEQMPDWLKPRYFISER